MRIVALVLLALSLAAPASAQQAQAPAAPSVAPYYPPDADLWSMMAKAFDDMPTTFATHVQIQNIMAAVQREADARAKAAAEKAEKEKKDKK